MPDDNPNPAPAPAPAAPQGTSLTTVNPQILDAVTKSNTAVLGAAKQEGSAVAHQKVAQAAALAVQDGTDQLRNIMTIGMTTIGICMKLMVEQKTTTPYSDIITQANTAMDAAQARFAAIGASAGTIVSNFPSGS
ncbi:MAG: hypothetical protein H7841_04065 [Magnetospirillum sp. WYHS-4]